MGVLKVVCVWYECWYDWGLIIWGFICLGTIALIFVLFYCSFLLGLSKLWVYLNKSCKPVKIILFIDLYTYTYLT